MRIQNSDVAYHRARRKVRMMRAFYMNLGAYATVITGLCVINLTLSPQKIWFIFPAMGWGVGLLIHGATVWGRSFWLGSDWEEKKIQQLLAKEQIRTLSTEKQLVEARLRLLQAQIEPHFLFNTLANVMSLITPAPEKAEAMLGNFIAYLRGSLAASRAQQGTFLQEFKLLEHYLDLLKIRMGDRLSYELKLAPNIENAPLAPMLLQPLVENAIRHGLEPKISGGSVRVTALSLGKSIRVRVEDDGLGFKPGPDAGIGLDNLKQRLAVLYDKQATLTVIDNHPGTLVEIELPL
jgi:sensor histidine kinase YesM